MDPAGGVLGRMVHGAMALADYIAWSPAARTVNLNILLISFAVLFILSATRYHETRASAERYLIWAFSLAGLWQGTLLVLNLTVTVFHFYPMGLVQGYLPPLDHAAFALYLGLLGLATLAEADAPVPRVLKRVIASLATVAALIGLADEPLWHRAFEADLSIRFALHWPDAILHGLYLALAATVLWACGHYRKSGLIPMNLPWLLLACGEVSMLAYMADWDAHGGLWGPLADIALLLHLPALLLAITVMDRHRLRVAAALLEGEFGGLVAALLSLVRVNNPSVQEHSERHADLASGLAGEVGMSVSEQKEVHWAALLHDVGKIGMDQRIFSLERRLTPEEWDSVRHHPDLGAQAVEKIEGLGRVADYIRGHHEHWDGSGYPAGHKGEAIPLGARIVCLVDAFDAMIGGRPYSRPKPLLEVVQELQRQSGKHFDPLIVDAFLGLLERKGLPVVRSKS